jgi:carboxypeptidase D
VLFSLVCQKVLALTSVLRYIEEKNCFIISPNAQGRFSMKKYLVACLLALNVIAWAQTYDQRSNRFRERMLVTIHGREDIGKLAQAAIEIDRCSGLSEKEVYAYATPYEVELIRGLGFAVQAAPEYIGQDSRDAAYHTYATLTQDLQNLASQYPQLAKLESIGKSVQGRELWALKISDNVGSDEAEPEAKYVCAMHGDEVVGKELAFYLARHLLENYNNDAWITQLVNDVEFWVIPSMNPDGTELKRRYNANYVDLNRNFPDPQDDPNNTPAGRAIETQNMMSFTAARNFVLALNYHGGAVVVNYPWDTKAGDVPDIALTKFVSLGYSKRNLPMYKSTSFKDGITNGYDWYEVNGGMQDWNYHWYGCLELTLEASQSKWPDASTLNQYWSDNRDSMLWYLSQARRGVHGTVREAGSGKSLRAEVNVLEIDKTTLSSQLHGDYHRLLMPGTYTLRFSAPGYQTATYDNVTVADSDITPTVLNTELQSSK